MIRAMRRKAIIAAGTPTMLATCSVDADPRCGGAVCHDVTYIYLYITSGEYVVVVECVVASGTGDDTL